MACVYQVKGASVGQEIVYIGRRSITRNRKKFRTEISMQELAKKSGKYKLSTDVWTQQ